MNRPLLVLSVFLLIPLQLFAQQVYFTDRKEAIAKFSPDNPEPVPIYESGELAISGIAVDQNAEWLYAMLDVEKLFRVRSDGSEVEIVAEFDTDPFGGAVIEVAVDDAKDTVYILGSTTLLKYDLKSHQLKPLVHEYEHYDLLPNRIALTDSFVYWSSRYEDLERGVIRRMAKNSRTPKTIVPEKYCYFVEALTVVDGVLYWIASRPKGRVPYESAIYAANADGSHPRVIHAPGNETAWPANDLTHFENDLYFETVYGGIHRLNLATGGVEIFLKINFAVDYMHILP